MSEINPFSNLGPLTLLGAVVGSVGAEIVHPHAYGLHLFPSTYITLKTVKDFTSTIGCGLLEVWHFTPYDPLNNNG